MILNGMRLLAKPVQSWREIAHQRQRPALWLVAAALTSSIWPAVAVVLGHVGSYLLGYVDVQSATLHAAVGLTSAVGGALVLAPALTLVVIWAAGAARSEVSARIAGPISMGFLSAAWFTGLVLAIPPLLGLAPVVGEFVWIGLALVAAWRCVQAVMMAALDIRRRWRRKFVVRLMVAFVLLFNLIVVGPAVLARSMIVETSLSRIDLPTERDLPRPPKPIW